VSLQNRYYSSIAPPTTLAASLAATGNPSVAAITGLPSSFPYSMLIDWGSTIAQGTTGAQEVISVTSAPTGSGPWSLPCTRGVDGTTAVAHNSGAQIVHGASAQDYNDPISYIGLHWTSPAAVSTVTVTAAAQTALTSLWSIPANDAAIGAAYEVTTYGTGTQGSTAQTLTFAAGFGSTLGVANSGITFPSSFAGTSAAFRWKSKVTATCVTTGSGGTWLIACEATVTSAAGDNSGTSVGAAVSFSTTTAENVYVCAAWGSTTGAPTLSSLTSRVARVA
jgi:hypothetical protein